MQEEWIAEWERERERCPQCGRDRSECADPDVDWYPQRSICWATVAREVAARKYREAYSRNQYHSGFFDFPSKEYDPELRPFSMFDGVSIWVSQIDHGEGGDFLPGADEIHRDEDDGH